MADGAVRADAMPPSASQLLVWAPRGRLGRELACFCLPELQEAMHMATTARQPDASKAPESSPPPLPPPLPPLELLPLGADGLAAQLAAPPPDLPLLLAAVRSCTLLTALIQPLAVAPTLEAAAAAALAALPPGSSAGHALRVLASSSGAARAPAERFLRKRLQQLGLGCAPVAGQPPLWCIQRPAPAAPEAPSHDAAPPPREHEYCLGLELAAGAPPPAASTAAALRRLGPTAMQPELAAASASLAGVRPGAAVLDPFCGSGSLLAAALQRSAALAVGSDVDDSHFSASCSAGGGGSGGSSGGVWSGLGGRAAFLSADAAALQGMLPAGAVDAVLTDLPYGFRAAAEVGGAGRGGAAGAAPAEEGWEALLGVLLHLAAHVLAPGGRLLTWLPRRPGGEEQQRRQLAAAGGALGLHLLHYLPETRRSGYPRAVALFQQQRQGSAGSSGASGGDRQAALLAAVQAAAAAGVPAYLPPPGSGLRPGRQAAPPADAATAWAAAPTQAAVRQRGTSYKQVRGAASGTAIDVWRFTRPLCSAAWLGDVAAIREYAAAGGDVSARDRRGQAPLQFAAGYGREAAVQALLELGADPAAAAEPSATAALHRAAARAHVGVLRRLLAGGADAWQRSATGQTPLMYASQFGHEAAVAALLEHLAAQAPEGDQQQQQQQQQPGADGLRRHLALCDAAGLTALHLAAQWGMAGVAEQLLRAGADPNQRSTCERQLTPAHLAARWGHPAVLSVLRSQGADLSARCTAQGRTPLQEAEEWRRPAAAALLREEAGGAAGEDVCETC